MAFQPSKSKKNLVKEEGSLNMNSMMDMMTIILLFLLKSFSTEGALITPSEQLKLPVSEQGEKPKRELSVSIGSLPVPGDTINEYLLLVNDKALASFRDIPQAPLLAPLADKLREFADKERELEAQVGKDFTHKVIIEGDEKIPYQLLFKVMYTCSQSEYYKMRLLTIKK